MGTTSRIVTNFLKSVIDKGETDVGRRGFLTGVVAAPIAGALSQVPAGKIASGALPDVSSLARESAEEVAESLSEVTSSFFKNMDQELEFGAEAYRAVTGKNVTPQELLERDMAEYLYFQENDMNPGMVEFATEKMGEVPVHSALEDVAEIAEESPEFLGTLQKYMGQADVYEYGSQYGDEITPRLFMAENPEKLFPMHKPTYQVPSPPNDYNPADVAEWIASKGIRETQYYKDLVKAGDSD